VPEPSLPVVKRADRQAVPVRLGQERPVAPLVAEGEAGPLPNAAAARAIRPAVSGTASLSPSLIRTLRS